MAHRVTGYAAVEHSMVSVLRFVASLPLAALAMTLTLVGAATTWLAAKCWAAGAWIIRD
jgi:hypothetical protein